MSLKQLPLLFSVVLTCSVLPASAAPALAYQSAFSDYKRFDDAKPRDWKQVNADVAKATGQAPMQGHDHAPAAVPAPAIAKPDPHAAHKHH